MVWKILLICTLICALTLSLGACATTTETIISEEKIEATITKTQGHYGRSSIAVSANGLTATFHISYEEYQYFSQKEPESKIMVCLVGIATRFETPRYELRPKCSDPIEGSTVLSFSFG
jgi:hypothetical protein